MGVSGTTVISHSDHWISPLSNLIWFCHFLTSSSAVYLQCYAVYAQCANKHTWLFRSSLKYTKGTLNVWIMPCRYSEAYHELCSVALLSPQWQCTGTLNFVIQRSLVRSPTNPELLPRCQFSYSVVEYKHSSTHEFTFMGSKSEPR